MPMSTVAVIHLVRACNGLKPVVAFKSSYDKYNSGFPHTIVLLTKGFSDSTSRNYILAPWSDRDYIDLPVPDIGFDIGSYLYAAQNLRHDYLVFVNSYGRIQSSDWLFKLMRAFDNPLVGIAGATGSFESLYTDQLFGPFPGTLPEFVQRLWFKYRFPPFPNPHIRTNAMAIKREVLLSLSIPSIRHKRHAWRVESGYSSITRQLMSKGLAPVVVGRDGAVYSIESWPKACVFRSGQQENLLIADNQTVLFEEAGLDDRTHLSSLAWGRPT